MIKIMFLKGLTRDQALAIRDWAAELWGWDEYGKCWDWATEFVDSFGLKRQAVTGLQLPDEAAVIAFSLKFPIKYRVST